MYSEQDQENINLREDYHYNNLKQIAEYRYEVIHDKT